MTECASRLGRRFYSLRPRVRQTACRLVPPHEHPASPPAKVLLFTLYHAIRDSVYQAVMDSVGPNLLGHSPWRAFARTWHWTRGVDVTGSLLNYQPALFSSPNWDGVTFSPTAPSSPMPAHPFAAIITPALVSGIEDWRNGSQVCFGMGLGWLGLQRAG